MTAVAARSARWATVAFALVVTVGAAGCAAPAGGPLVVWTAGSLTRVGPTDPATGTTAVTLTAARNEYESFQVVVSAGGGVADVDLEVSELRGPDGAVIPRTALTLYREQYVTVERGTPGSGGGNEPTGAGRYADGLIPFVDPENGTPLRGEINARGAAVEAGENQPYWVDVLVPSTAPAGRYTGTYRVRTDLGSFDGTVTLTVLDLTLPETPALYTSFGSRTGAPAVSRELLRNRVMPGAEAAQLGPLAADAGVNAVDTGFYGGADRDTCALDPPPPAAEIAEVAGAVTGLRPGALLYNYTADEVAECGDLTAGLQEWARTLHQAGVRQLVTIPPDPALFSDGAGGAGVDIWALLPKDFDPAMIDRMRRARSDMQVWSYTAVAQDDYSPKWLIDFSPVNFRVLPGFLNQSLGLTGTLYWRVDNWGKGNPWDTAVLYDREYPGDGMLVYPGEQVGLPGGVAPSIRLKWIRDGVEDYGYAALARATGRTEAVTRIVRSVGTDWRTWSKDPAQLERARQELAECATRP